MKIYNQHNSSSVLRFRRWSRKGFALFVSVSFVVNIGVLSVSVSEKSSLKSSICTEQVAIVADFDMNDDDDEAELAEIKLLANLTETNNQSDCAPAYGLLNILLNISGCYSVKTMATAFFIV